MISSLSSSKRTNTEEPGERGREEEREAISWASLRALAALLAADTTELTTRESKKKGTLNLIVLPSLPSSVIGYASVLGRMKEKNRMATCTWVYVDCTQRILYIIYFLHVRVRTGRYVCTYVVVMKLSRPITL